MNRKFKQHSFETEMLCDIMNVFTVPVDQFKTCLLNKILIFLPPILLTPNFLNGSVEIMFSPFD